MGPLPFLTTVFWPSHPPLSTLDLQPSCHKPNYLFLLLDGIFAIGQDFCCREGFSRSRGFSPLGGTFTIGWDFCRHARLFPLGRSHDLRCWAGFWLSARIIVVGLDFHCQVGFLPSRGIFAVTQNHCCPAGFSLSPRIIAVLRDFHSQAGFLPLGGIWAFRQDFHRQVGFLP